MKRREFLQLTTTGIAGTALCWTFGGTIAFAQVKWEDEKESVPLWETDDHDLSRLQHFEPEWQQQVRGDWPDIVCDAEGRLWVAHVQQTNAGERVLMRSLSPNGTFGEDVRLDEGEGQITHLTLVAHGDGLVATWSEKRGDDWVVMAREVRGGTPGRLVRVSQESGISWKPAAVSAGGELVVAWERKPDFHSTDPFVVHARAFAGTDLSSPGDVQLVSRADGRDANRAALAAGANGRVWIAWDEEGTEPGQRTVYLASSDGVARFGTPVRVSHHPAANLSPAVAVDAEGRPWIAFTSCRRGEDEWDIPRWIYLLCYDGERFHEPIGTPPALNLDKEGTDQSFEFARLFAGPDGKIVVTGRPSHNFCLQYYHGSEWSPLYRFPVDSWGGRGQFLNGAWDKEGNFWIVRREYGGNVVQKIADFVASPDAVAPQVQPSGEAAFAGVALANVHHAPRRWDPLEEIPGTEEPLHFFYGDIHGHTRMSDGVGDVDEYFLIRRDYYEDDFASLTDHDYFVRLPIFPSGWELQKVMTQHYHRDGRFVTFFGQEYTTARYPTRVGHKCIWSTDPAMPLLVNNDARYNTSEKLNTELHNWDAIMAPHHTGWTGTDWADADLDVQMLAEIISDHGVFEHVGNQPIPHRGGMRGHFLQDALAMGLKIGFYGSSDAHGLIWHHGAGWRRDCYRGGLMCVLAKELTREALFDAMRKRHVFATSGIKPRMDFRVNGHIMGEEITIPRDEPVRVSIDLAGRHRVRWVTIVRNNKDWYQYGGDGFTTRFTVEDEDPPEGTAWYYARVEYHGPEMAWSSPIWVTRA